MEVRELRGHLKRHLLEVREALEHGTYCPSSVGGGDRQNGRQDQAIGDTHWARPVHPTRHRAGADSDV